MRLRDRPIVRVTDEGFFDFGDDCRVRRLMYEKFGVPRHHTDKTKRESGWRGHDYGRTYYLESEVMPHFLTTVWATSTETYFMNVLEELKANYDEAAALWKNYEERLAKFRSMVKNDIASLDASATKSAAATRTILQSHQQIIAQMNSVEMNQAITNAERLAAALSTLASMKASDIDFSISGKNKA